MVSRLVGSARLRTPGAIAAVGAAALLAAGLAGCTSGSSSATGAGNGGSASPVALPSGGAGDLQRQYQDVIKAVLPSVVQINTDSGTGSGVVYDDKGDIVTNAHVVGDADDVQVLRATGGDALTAKVLGVFAPDDLAVIRVNSGAGSLRSATFVPSSNVTAGQIVLAMGNPLGLTGSVTQGIISAVDRTVTEGGGDGSAGSTIANALQTSADINGGNSGGALVDLSGQVIGIPSAAARDPEAGAAPGIGFAIPSSTVISIAGQIISTGRVSQSGRASLGISAATAVTTSGEPAGVSVVAVSAGGPADKAGIQAGDVITAVNDRETASLAALTAVLATLKPGATVPVSYLSDSGATVSTTVTLGSLSS